jgi:hypothetical protein
VIRRVVAAAIALGAVVGACGGASEQSEQARAVTTHDVVPGHVAELCGAMARLSIIDKHGARPLVKLAKATEDLDTARAMLSALRVEFRDLASRYSSILGSLREERGWPVRLAALDAEHAAALIEKALAAAAEAMPNAQAPQHVAVRQAALESYLAISTRIGSRRASVHTALVYVTEYGHRRNGRLSHHHGELCAGFAHAFQETHRRALALTACRVTLLAAWKRGDPCGHGAHR